MMRDVETGEKRITALDTELVDRYRKKVAAFISDIKEFCSDYGIGYYVYDTSILFEEFLIDYFTRGRIFR